MNRKEIADKILEIVKSAFPDNVNEDFLKLSPDELENKVLLEELGLDSLDAIVLELHLEREFNIPFGYEECLKPFREIVDYIYNGSSS